MNQRPLSFQDATKQAAVRRFHTHLDECAQCRDHPFDLCEVGASLLVEAGHKEQEVMRREAKLILRAPSLDHPALQRKRRKDWQPRQYF